MIHISFSFHVIDLNFANAEEEDDLKLLTKFDGKKRFRSVFTF